MSNLERLTFTVDEAAAMLGLSRNLAYAGVASGEIPSVKIGRRILVPRLALERLLTEAGGSGTDALSALPTKRPKGT